MTRSELFKKYEEEAEKELNSKDWKKFRKGWEAIKDSPNQEEKKIKFKSLVEELLHISGDSRLNNDIHKCIENWKEKQMETDEFLSEVSLYCKDQFKKILEDTQYRYGTVLFDEYYPAEQSDQIVTGMDNVYLLDIFYISIKYYFKEIGKVIEKMTGSYRMIKSK